MAPTWTPALPQIAAYVPHRTLVRDIESTVGSQDEYVWTFDATTTPPAASVTVLADDASVWVAAHVVPVHASMEDLARAVSALLAAAWVERAWPHDDQSLQRANDMEKRVDTMLARLASANTDANTEDGTSIPTPTVPYWSFPGADPRFDDASYW